MDILEELNIKMLGATTPSWAQRAANEIASLRAANVVQKDEIADLTFRLNSAMRMTQFNLRDLDELRAKKFARFKNEECWIYQGDGQDHLESLVCPVVIDAKILLKLLKKN